jgi:hypothetical protein
VFQIGKDIFLSFRIFFYLRGGAKEKRFCMARGLSRLSKKKGRIQAARCASVVVYLGPAAQTPRLFETAR